MAITVDAIISNIKLQLDKFKSLLKCYKLISSFDEGQINRVDVKRWSGKIVGRKYNCNQNKHNSYLLRGCRPLDIHSRFHFLKDKLFVGNWIASFVA